VVRLERPQQATVRLRCWPHQQAQLSGQQVQVGAPFWPPHHTCLPALPRPTCFTCTDRLYLFDKMPAQGNCDDVLQRPAGQLADRY